MRHEPKKHFDISKPHHHGPDPTSKPIIVGHHPTMPDPMLTEQREKASKPINVISDGKVLPRPTKADELPDLSDLSAAREASPALTPSSVHEPASPPGPTQAPAPESVPGAVFSPLSHEPQNTPPEPAAPEISVAAPTPITAATTQPSHTPSKEPTAPTPQEPPAGQELHIPAGHGHAAVHHQPRIWVWAVAGLIVLVWAYVAIDALTTIKLPYEFFKT